MQFVRWWLFFIPSSIWWISWYLFRRPFLNSNIVYLVFVHDLKQENFHTSNSLMILFQIKDEGGCTLIHCVAGVSRSASLCLAYLIKYNQMNFHQAFHYLRSLRPCIRPNLGFFKQLINYEKRFYAESSVEIVYNAAAQTYIPSVYEEDYSNMLTYQRYCGRH